MTLVARHEGVVVVLDAGSGGGRCLAVDPGGTIVAFAHRPWTMRIPPDSPMGSVFDPTEWWDALAGAARDVAARARGPFLAVACTSLRDGAVFLDGEGRELYCGTNRDARAVGLGFEMAQNVGDLQWRLAGRWPLGLDVAARLVWFRRTAPDLFARIRHVLSIADWMVYRLTGEIWSEPTNSSATGLFDVDSGLWSRELALAHGVEPALLPPVRWPGEIAGVLTRPASEALGLAEGVPVAVGLGDSQAGCLGCAAWGSGDTVIIAGTTAPVMQVSDRPFRDPARRIWTGAYAAPGKWVVESNAGVAGAVYAWFTETFLGPGEAYAALEAEASAAPPGRVLAWLGPSVADFSSLSSPPDSVIRFPALGFFSTPTRGALARAVLENIAYALRGNLEQLPARPAEIRLCGGLSRSLTFARILASVAGVPLVSPRSREGTGVGAAAAAAVAAGAYPDLPAAAAAMVSLSDRVDPEPALVEEYSAAYAAWRAGQAR